MERVEADGEEPVDVDGVAEGSIRLEVMVVPVDLLTDRIREKRERELERYISPEYPDLVPRAARSAILSFCPFEPAASNCLLRGDTNGF
jgi:hypothetical protein